MIAFVAEPVVGATMGAVPPVAGYFRAVRGICDRYGMLLILDEVMCGMGRTGTLFACEQEGVRPDLVTIAKGLGAGYQAIGATLVSRAIYEAIVAGSGFFQHGHTYMAHPTACAAGWRCSRRSSRSSCSPGCASRAPGCARSLSSASAAMPHVGDIRGRGLFQALELVADRASKRPFPPERRLHARVKAAALERGLMVYAMGGTIDGQRGDHIVLAPPYIVTDADLEAIIERLGAALDAALAHTDQAAA